MKLKTAKEIVEECTAKLFRKESFNIEQDFKQEAIKEIKVLKNLGESKEDLLWERITGKKIVYSKEAVEVIIRYIKWKFNLIGEDLKEENSGEMLRRLGTDGELWTKEFMKLFGNNKDKMDFELMMGWFCNAIEAGRSAK